MAKLIYSMLASLDGYIADEDGNFDWAAPDEEVHQFVNDVSRPIGTFLLGRRLYEVLEAWESPEMLGDPQAAIRDFAQIWLAADKVIYSRTLPAVSTSRTSLERQFDVDAVLQLKSRAQRDIAIGGPDLASQALRAGLVDELQLFVVPEIVGGGKRWLPDDLRLQLELVDERRFGNGTVYLCYRPCA
jgi:dihydrofolate reductase